MDKANELLIAATYFKEFLAERVKAGEHVDPSAYISWLFAKSMEVQAEIDKL